MHDSTKLSATAKAPASITTAPTEVKLACASHGARFVNWVVDLLAIYVIRYVAGLVVTAWGDNHVAHFVSRPYDIVFDILVILAYYLVLEGTMSKSLGKFVTRTHVVSKDGGRPTFAQILGRTFVRLIPLDQFTFFDTPPRGWHDQLPRGPT